MNDIPQQIERLDSLRNNGTLSEEEFQAAKQQLLSDGNAGSAGQSTGGEDGLFGFTEPTWCLMMHLSQLFLFAGGVGIAVPIVLWIISKDKSMMASRHGSRMMNWIVSSFIYKIVAGFLCLFFIGIPILIALLVLDVAFPVVAGVKANDNVDWSYPMAIRFFNEK